MEVFRAAVALMGKHVWVGLLGNLITIEHAGKVAATYTSQKVPSFGVTEVFSPGGYVTPP